MASPTDIRLALAAALETIPGVHVSPYALGNAPAPCIEVTPGKTVYDKAMGRGADDLTFTIRAYVASTLDRSAQHFLDLMLEGSGVHSVKAAAERDRTLGGACTSLHVTENAGYIRIEREPGHLFLGSEWTVLVLASGT